MWSLWSWARAPGPWRCDPAGGESMRREMTLARQFLLLQLLIVLAVLVAVVAISLAQSARSFERTRGPAGAAAPPRTSPATRPCAQPLRGAERRAAVRAAARRRVRPDRSPDPPPCSWPAPTGSCSRPRTPPRSATQLRLGASRVLDGAAWTGVQHDVGGARRRAHVPVSTIDGNVDRHRRDRSRLPVRLVSGSATSSPNLLIYLGVASVLGLGGSLLLARRVKRQTLGHGADARSPGSWSTARRCCTASRKASSRSTRSSRVTVVNDSARQLLELPGDCVGRRSTTSASTPQAAWRCSPPTSPGRTGWCSWATGWWCSTGGRCGRTAAVIGSVTTLRDRTELVRAGARARHQPRHHRHAARPDPRVRQPAAHHLRPDPAREYDEVVALRRRRSG